MSTAAVRHWTSEPKLSLISVPKCFEPFKRMYENGSKIALNLTCSKGFK